MVVTRFPAPRQSRNKVYQGLTFFIKEYWPELGSFPVSRSMAIRDMSDGPFWKRERGLRGLRLPREWDILLDFPDPNPTLTE